MILDSIFVVLIGMSSALGYKRGFTDEIIRMVVLVVSGFGAYGFFRMSPYLLQSYIQQDVLLQASSGLISIVGLLLFFKLARKFLVSMIKSTPLAVFDKVLGLGFGGARGLLLVVVLYWVSGIFLTQQLQAVLPVWGDLSTQTLAILPPNWRTFVMSQFLNHHADFKASKAQEVDQAFRSLVDLKAMSQNKLPESVD